MKRYQECNYLCNDSFVSVASCHQGQWICKVVKNAFGKRV
jgi:hypothetical protein